jgi:ribonuclease III
LIIVSDLQALQSLQEAIGYTFRDPNLLVSALTHASIADSRVQSNERLEFLGDAILGLAVCDYLYRRFPDYLEGEMTKIKSAVVSRRTCAVMARDLGLPKYLYIGKGMSSRGQLPSSVAAAVYEALVAAVYLDSGSIDRACQFVIETVGKHIAKATASEHQRNFKSQLQQYAQQALSATPNYELLDEKGPDHSKCFEVGVVIKGRRYGSAWGPSKKEAEQKAAYLALRELDAVELTAEFESEDTDH